MSQLPESRPIHVTRWKRGTMYVDFFLTMAKLPNGPSFFFEGVACEKTVLKPEKLTWCGRIATGAFFVRTAWPSDGRPTSGASTHHVDGSIDRHLTLSSADSRSKILRVLLPCRRCPLPKRSGMRRLQLTNKPSMRYVKPPKVSAHAWRMFKRAAARGAHVFCSLWNNQWLSVAITLFVRTQQELINFDSALFKFSFSFLKLSSRHHFFGGVMDANSRTDSHV